jgi:kinesin family protein 2/24
MKEDVPRNLTMRDDGSVVETRVERVVAPVRWNNAHIRAWIARPGNEKLAAKVIVPKSLAGRDIVRMNPAALLKLCGGDHKLSQVMHNKLREEIARCSSKNLS